MAEDLSDEFEEDIEDTLKGKYLTFVVGKEVYGIEIVYVVEIIAKQEITEVPELPIYVKGFINLRGNIIPVIDIRLKFKKPPADYNDRTCIIVISINDISVGLIVDSVADVISIADEAIAPPPDRKTGFHNRYIKGIGKVENEVKLLIECEMLFTEEEVENLSNI